MNAKSIKLFFFLCLITNILLISNIASAQVSVVESAFETAESKGFSGVLLLAIDGKVVFEKATERVEGIDVQVILGDSFVNFLATGAKPDPNINPEDLAVNAADALTTETTP